ncbi:MAG: hypothetical protein CM15mP45_01880 [Deltaproteobacteria bacterium]|nr:MAG: hypothetical protein CM15mP45_01880 [Deltaproteobacteria bacterium]
MLISIIIPVYNEINTIIELLELIQRSPIWRNNEKDVIVIDDNSIDGTYELLLKMIIFTKRFFVIIII